MFDDIGRMPHDSGYQHTVLGQVHLVPHRPLVLVTGIGRLERQVFRIDGEHIVDDLPQRDVRGVGTVPRTPTQVETHLCRVDTLERGVDRITPHLDVPPIVLDTRRRVDLVPGLRQGGVVDLDGQPGLGDRQVFLAKHLGTGLHDLLVIGVVGIVQTSCRAGRDRGDESVPTIDSVGVQGSDQAVNVLTYRLSTRVGERPGDDGEDGCDGASVISVPLPGMWQNCRWRIGIDVGEVLPVTTILEIDECDLGSRCWRR